jgi:hypothetical protein
MRKILIFSLVIIFSFDIQAQTDKVDFLLEELNNNQLYGTCNYNWVLKMKSEPADSLVNIGKSISKKLIPLLDNPNKGIITHCILSRIWIKDEDFWMSFSSENFDTKGIIEYNYNGLLFYEKDGKMIVDKKILLDNKKRWIEKIN